MLNRTISTTLSLMPCLLLCLSANGAVIHVGVLQDDYAQLLSSRISGLGYSTTLWTNSSQVSSSTLESIDVLYVGSSNAAGLASKSGIVADWVARGNGLIVEQPNRSGVVGVLPPGLSISIWSSAYDGSQSGHDSVRDVILTDDGLTHPITVGLTPQLLPGNVDRVLRADVSSQYQILGVQVTNLNYVAIAAANYQSGRVVFHTGNLDLRSQNPGSDRYLQQIINWAAVPEPSSDLVGATGFMMTVALLRPAIASRRFRRPQG